MITQTRSTSTPGRGSIAAVAESWPLIGRDDELAVLTNAITGPDPRSVVLVGAAGVGKTRLAREAMRIASGGDRETRWVTATRSVARTPFGALAALLTATGDAQGIGPADSFEGLMRRTAESLTARDSGSRLVLFVDDAQLLDEASAGLIQQLVSTDAVLVVATIRTGEPTPTAISALWKDDVATRIRLHDVADGAIDALLTAVRDRHAPQRALRSRGLSLAHD